MVHLMQFEKEDVLEIPLLKSMDDKPIASLTPADEAELLDEPQEAQVTTTCPLRYKKQAPEPDGATGLGKATTESQD